MQFSLGHVLQFLDLTILNPLLTLSIAFGLQVFTDNKITVQVTTDSFFPFVLGPIPSLQSQALKLVTVGVFLRMNRYLSGRARNNAVAASFDWSKEIIVVTGASGGIGAEAAKRLASRDGSVIVLDVIPPTYSLPVNVHYYQCDLMDFNAVQAMGERIRKEIGDPTCVVANAGICRGKPILAASKRDIELTFGVNNLGLLWTAKTFLPSMAQANHGHFLIIASQTDYLATAGVVDYAATKSAAIAIYEGLQTELKHTYKAPAVRVSVINPSAVKTKMFDGIKSPSNFFMPKLSPKDVGDVICETLWSGDARNLMIPAFAYISAPTRCLPDWLRIGMQDGGAEVMTELRPHQPLK